MTRRMYWRTLWAGWILLGVGALFNGNSAEFTFSFVSEWGFTEQQAGLAIAMHQLGSLLGMIYMFIWVGDINIRKYMLFAVSAVAGLEALTGIVGGVPEFVITVRFFSGIAAGLCMATGLVLIGYLPNNLRIFSIGMILGFIMLIITLFYWAPLVELVGLRGVFFILTAYCLVCLPFHKLVPDFVYDVSPDIEKDKSFAMSDLFLPVPLLILVAFLLANTGSDAIWTYSLFVGLGEYISMTRVTELFAYSLVGGLVSATLATYLCHRFSYYISFAIGYSVIVIGTLLLFRVSSEMTYLLAFSLFAFGYAFAIPYLQSLQSDVDSTGRLLILGLMAAAVGKFLGPFLAAILAGDWFILTNVFWLACACFALSLILVLIAVYKYVGAKGSRSAVR